VEAGQQVSAWTRQAWEEATGFGEEEQYLVDAIKKHLLTPEQNGLLEGFRLSIEDVLNGRVGMLDTSWARTMLEQWNSKLGWHEFLSECY